ncbi:MAG: DICT sensory domain-containing protein, partial [Elainella sp.]
MLEGSILRQLSDAHRQFQSNSADSSSQNSPTQSSPAQAEISSTRRPLNFGVYYKNTLVALCHALEDAILQADYQPL